MAKHRVRVGLHARNDVQFPEPDFELVRLARIETLKTLSLTDVGVYRRLRQEIPDIEFIVRLYDGRINRDSRPSPSDFVAKMLPVINRLKPYVTKFEIHNEPNHAHGIEGWGASDENARAFRDWYMKVLRALKQACPWAQFGFPGLALNHPHRDLEWLDLCREAIGASDWLGCHCYWQYSNMLVDPWGLRFKLYHERFPDKQIEITEFGNSTPNVSRDQVANEYVRYYQEVSKYPYLLSASAFIASSPDPAWAPFAWMKEGGQKLPVVDAVRHMNRQAVEVTMPPKPEPAPSPTEPSSAGRKFTQTGKTVRGNFLKFLDQYGLDICGYPITDEIEEAGVLSQYFQRVGLEVAKSGKIELKQVGAEAWASRAKIVQFQARIEELMELPPIGPGLARPAIQDVADKLPTHESKRYPQRSLADISQIVIHHTGTSPAVTPQSIAEYQVQKAGKPGILYHFFIAADGTVFQCNRLATVTDHAHERSQASVGVCFAGSFSEGIPSAAQLQAGGTLCAWLLSRLYLLSERIVGAGEFASTQSPGTQWLQGRRWKDKLLLKVKTALETEDTAQRQYIARLKAQIAMLHRELERYRREPPSAPIPAQATISRPAIQNLVEKLPRHETKQYDTRSREAIEALVIHHSAVAPAIGPQQIANYHTGTLDWPGIGYHFLIGADGTIHQGNRLETVSHHAASVNPRGVGICFLGNFTTEIPPAAQLESGARLAAWLLQELGLGLDEVKGHREFMHTACPGNQWLYGKTWKQALRQEIEKVR